MNGEMAQRFMLYSQLTSCPLAGWYARLTGDERTATQFERVRQRMLAKLNSPVPVEQSTAPVESSVYQQLSLL